MSPEYWAFEMAKLSAITRLESFILNKRQGVDAGRSSNLKCMTISRNEDEKELFTQEPLFLLLFDS
jgi:hypothetical protein